MGLGGFALGGFADAFQKGNDQNSLANYRTEELKLQQQSQQNQQQREQFARIDKARTEMTGVISDTIEQLKIAGKDEATIAKTIQPLVQPLKKLIKSSGSDDSMIDAQVAAELAKPSKAVTERALTQAKESPLKNQLIESEIQKNKASAANLSGTSGTDTSGLEGNTLRDALAKHSGLTPDELDVNGRALAAGNTSVLQNLGRGRQGGEAVKATRAWAANILIHEQGLSPPEAAEALNANTSEFKGRQAGASALGRREAQVIGASTTAMQTAPRVLEASTKVDRTQYPTLNKALMAWREGTGDENVVRFGIAVNTFVNNYARALGAGNAAVTDSARKEAFENLNKAWSQGQISSAIDQMLNKELPSEVAGAHMGMKEFLGNRALKKAGDQTSKTYKFNSDTGELEAK